MPAKNKPSEKPAYFKRPRYRGVRNFATTLPDGRRVIFFVNKATGLVVVDVADADDKGGVELLRVTL